MGSMRQDTAAKASANAQEMRLASVKRLQYRRYQSFLEVSRMEVLILETSMALQKVKLQENPDRERQHDLEGTLADTMAQLMQSINHMKQVDEQIQSELQLKVLTTR